MFNLNLHSGFAATAPTAPRYSVLEFRSAGLCTVHDRMRDDVLCNARDGLPLAWNTKRAAERFAAVLNRCERTAERKG